MKKNLFTVLGLLGAATGVAYLLAFLSSSMHAQPAPGGGIIGTPSTLILSGSGNWTNRIAASTSVTNTVRYDTGNALNVYVQWALQATTVGPTNCTLEIRRSVDGVYANAELCCLLTNTTSATALTTTYVYTNLNGNVTVGGAKYLFFNIMSNATAGGFLTNYSVTVNSK
jgi:hypothetical protein